MSQSKKPDFITYRRRSLLPRYPSPPLCLEGSYRVQSHANMYPLHPTLVTCGRMVKPETDLPLAFSLF